ncbi:hypothetical protein C8R44DRAFT_817265 [Mycena epipterygia]|nr:hypothetical protein C8R44DRAFT_817265 [Mycena epipterygia]
MDMVSRGQGNMARIDKRVSGFYKYWRDRPFPCFDTFPYKLHLGCDEYGHPLLPLRGRETSGTTILVTQAYADTFQRIWQFREAGSAHEGIVLTGQPGIGAFRSPDSSHNPPTCSLSFPRKNHRPSAVRRQPPEGRTERRSATEEDSEGGACA